MPVKFSIYDSHNRFDINVMVEFTEPEEKHKTNLGKMRMLKKGKLVGQHPPIVWIEEKNGRFMTLMKSPARFAVKIWKESIFMLNKDNKYLKSITEREQKESERDWVRNIFREGLI